MNILFLGGNRYFGKKILSRLLKSKHTIYLINRDSKKYKHKNKNLIHIKSDRNKLKKNGNKIKNIFFDVVFDNIAYKLSDVLKLHSFLKNNFNHYIFTSSIITYLNLNTGHEVSENEWHKGKINNSVKLKYSNYQLKYAINKKRIENYLINNKNINSTILRVPAVIGKKDFSKKTERLLNYQSDKIKKKYLSEYIQFIFEKDLVRIIFKIINKKENKCCIYNVANQKIKIKDFYIKLSKIKKKFKIKDKKISNNTFPLPINSLMNCSKIKKKYKFKFSSIDKGLVSVV